MDAAWRRITSSHAAGYRPRWTSLPVEMLKHRAKNLNRAHVYRSAR